MGTMDFFTNLKRGVLQCNSKGTKCKAGADKKQWKLDGHYNSVDTHK